MTSVRAQQNFGCFGSTTCCQRTAGEVLSLVLIDNFRRNSMRLTFILTVVLALFVSCTQQDEPVGDTEMRPLQRLVDRYALVEISTDVEGLTEQEQALVDKLIEAARIIDEIFWLQASEDGVVLREKLSESTDPADAVKLDLLEINKFGFDRLNDNAPFIDTVPLPDSGTFWPEDITQEELETYTLEHPEEKAALYDLYTIVRRDGDLLKAVPYHEVFKDKLGKVADLLNEAADLSEDEEFANYLRMRAGAMLKDDYFDSDMAWMDLAGKFDCVFGPIEVYEDRLMNLKTSYEAFVLLRDQAASEELESYIAAMEEMQQALPVDDAFKRRKVQLGSSVGVFTQLFVSGHSEAGSKTIAISLPNDPRVRAAKGARKIMLRNAIDAKFQNILKPISERMIAPDQLALVNGDMFFSNVLLHEIAHSLGNDYVLDASGNETEITIDEALKEASSSIEECKADIGGLYSASVMVDKDALSEEQLREAYVTFLAGIFRTVRFGASSAHGVANAIAVNWLIENGGITIDDNGRYQVDFENFHAGLESLLAEILTIQNTGNYERAANLIDDYGALPDDIVSNLAEMDDIPVDIRYVWK
jgi:hypothetical protein